MTPKLGEHIRVGGENDESVRIVEVVGYDAAGNPIVVATRETGDTSTPHRSTQQNLGARARILNQDA